MVAEPCAGRGQSPVSSSAGGSATSKMSTDTEKNDFSSEGYGSASSLDLSFTSRSLGSRGSLIDDTQDDLDNINVIVRCRPLSDKEGRSGDEMNITFPGEGQIWVNIDGTNGKQTQKPKTFTYNVVFEPEATQEDVFEHSGVKRLVEMAVDGFSSTVFCYGQTGSGKTHTLTGPPHLFEKDSLYNEDHGLIFRSFVYIFNVLRTREEQQFTLTASYLEIYNEKVIDLLNFGPNNQRLQVRWSKKNGGFFVENLFTIECAELDDLLAVLEEGMKNRAVASHNMNEYSSRSHTILSVNIQSEQKTEDVFITRNGKINFVDLAGSEITKKTKSEGKTLEEANNINKSLMVLGTCISALSDSKKRDGHIPYRDSKLTKLLADSLAGSGVTLMDPKEKLILSLQREINLLTDENSHLKVLLELGPDHNNGSSKGLTDDKVVNIGYGFAEEELLKKIEMGPGKISRQTSFKVDKDKLSSLDVTELVSLVQHYMTEHEIVRAENKELLKMTDALIKDQEQISKENERLLKKLEDLSSTGNGSADSGGRRNGEMMIISAGKPKGTRESRLPQRVKDTSNNSLEKRRIGKSTGDLTNAGQRTSVKPANHQRSGSLDRNKAYMNLKKSPSPKSMKLKAKHSNKTQAQPLPSDNGEQKSEEKK